MIEHPGVLTVYETGKLTVVGFGGHDALDEVNLAECRDEIIALIKEHQCETMAFDLTAVKLIPSGLLGLIASLKKLEVDVHLYNPSDEIREVLRITKLDQMIELHELDVTAGDE